MKFNINKLRRKVFKLISLIPASNEKLNYLHSFLKKKDYQSHDVENLMHFLSQTLLDDVFTIPVASCFEDCILLLTGNALENNSITKDFDIEEYQMICIALSKLMHLSSCVKRYAQSYFLKKPPPFMSSCEGIVSKKLKKVIDRNPNTLSIIKCCYYLLKADASFFKDLWDWSEFIRNYANYCDNDNTILKVYFNHIIAILSSMNSSTLRKLNENISEEILIMFEDDQNSLRLIDTTNTTPLDNALISASNDVFISESFLSTVTNIEGVFLPIYNKNNYEYYRKIERADGTIVCVESTKLNLRSIALGVTSGKAICLSGPVGCGKTTLVEYLAHMTGRIALKKQQNENEKHKSNDKIQQIIDKKKRRLNIDYENLESFDNNFELTQSTCDGFLRIQLGDQTDSKMLLGQYHCTDVPGEFIWLPGVLTQAVTNGYWLLLEDLDCATTDTFTVLASLFENNFLSVPGFRDCVKITPGFQLFATVRTHKSSLSNTAQKALFSLLEKHLYPVNILPLSRNELCQVIQRKYPKLTTVANRIVDVFLNFSSGDHNVTDNLRQQEIYSKPNVEENILQLPCDEINVSSLTSSSRLVSTRDLIKLCQRANPDFSVTSTDCAYFVFQNAVDVFCSYLPNSKEKTKLITSIGAKLGIIQSRCEHFSNELKPDIYVDNERIKVGRIELYARDILAANEQENVFSFNERNIEEQSLKRLKLSNNDEKSFNKLPMKLNTLSTTFSFTRLASCLLERVAVCVSNAEPVLLVGETGVGKTSSIQYLAARTRHQLVVVNMNNQSDVSDLVGGFKPVDLTYIISPLRNEFELLFRQTFNQSKNEPFLSKFSICYNQGNFSVIVKLMLQIVTKVFEKSERKELREKDLQLLPRWIALKTKLHKLNNQLNKCQNISFAFIPGSLVNCIKNGNWILLDEINLASAETLECLSTILEPDGSVVLLEQGDFLPVKRHPDFRIFSCMNPNTDIGKKDLPVGIRNRFTEFFVDEAETEADLSLLVTDYLSATGIQRKSVMNIVKLYKRLKSLAKLELNDGLGNRPVYSLRTLCRSLTICAKNLCGSIERNLYESFCLSFLTQLDPVSHNVVQHLIKEALLGNANAILKQSLPKPGVDYISFQGYWIKKGPKELQDCNDYILTDSVKENLRDLARIISIGKLPILLQGPTSAGKTSLIDYVAKRSGNHCLRINNHEHTDLQEYIGTYTTDISGKLVFKEGVLIQAMRNGYWIILDELNLASTEILEALNRVLDDNREIFIPETQTVVKSHDNFMLFATQNPPGLYGGRKTLSRAFKNRFIELHFSDIPRNELEIILEKKCLIPASYARKMVACMVDLQKNRKNTSRNTFTLRDLFRWGIRYTLADKKLLNDAKYDWNQHLVEEGYLVLSAKVRTEVELEIIDETLNKNFKKHVNLSRLFDANTKEPKSLVTKDIIDEIQNFKSRTDIVWTRNMTRMAVLIAKALQFNEPVLLVGPTGCGKTTVCQLLAAIRGVNLRILNCHMHTEGADFLGSLRPCRNNSTEQSSKKMFEWSDGPLIQSMQEGSFFMADEISLAEDSVLERLNCILEPERTVLLAEKCGSNLAEDSLGGIAKDIVIKARPGFQFFATMNPGGDFGKRELSLALRNRFTEIWCQPSDSRDDLIEIANNCIKDQLKNSIMDKAYVLKMATYIVDIVFYMRNSIEKFKYSIRDILAMANYMVVNTHLSFPEKAIFALETTFLDAIEMTLHESSEKIEFLKEKIIEYAIKQASLIMEEEFSLSDVLVKKGTHVEFNSNNCFGIKPFFIKTKNFTNEAVLNTTNNFLFDVPTTKCNLFRLLSAFSLNKPILLEGPPGVGKTSIVENLARAIGFNIVRINLCEHTDLADLFGTDLPIEDNLTDLTSDMKKSTHQVGSFEWRDGPLLAALKAENSWILLDELNLAPQSVLEGLNAILDHRGEVFIPELNKTFILSKQTRIFASQNPLKQGGGRKGLPQSFLNRFTKVYVRKLTTEDLLYVVKGKYHSFFNQIRDTFVSLLPLYNFSSNDLFDIYNEMKKQRKEKLQLQPSNNCAINAEFDLGLRLVKFSELLDNGITNMEFGYRGGPYEINLRDILFWCELLISPQTGFLFKKVGFEENFDNFLQTLYERMKLSYYQRMRSDQDKQFIRKAFEKTFNCNTDELNLISEDVGIYWTSEKIYFNDIILDRSCMPLNFQKSFEHSPLLLETQTETLKNLIECLHLEKPVLLCGSTDTGKTKIIDTLCSLSNQLCYVDNIDDSVTGSFQQIDLNRHLEEITQKVEGIYLKLIQTAFLDISSLNELTKNLFKSWNAYCVLRNQKTEFKSRTFVSEELSNYRRRLDKLNNVIEILLKCLSGSVNSEETEILLQNIINRLRLLKLYVKNADTLNTGGCFEWVDSKIVKSLKDGNYILLEHVNLCSSAVLDRLNSVFEPNGCLVLSEKGVTDDETTNIVQKSNNFRAFLTLDPKNGEISRAMRNRCVEIYSSHRPLNLDDKRKLLFNEGVPNTNAINIIISIHDNISNLTEVNTFSISHLTRTGFLCASYCKIGYKMEEAIYISAMEVYVYSATTDLLGYGLSYYQSKLKEIVLAETDKFKNMDIVCQNDCLRDVVLKCESLTEIKLVKLQIVPIRIILDSLSQPKQIKLILSSILSDFESVNMESISFKELIKFLIYMHYEVSSMNDLRFRYLQFKKYLNNDDKLLNLSETLYKCIERFNKDYKCGLPSLPLNGKLYPRIRDYNIKSLNSQKDVELCLSFSLILNMLLKDIPQALITKLSSVSILTYSQAVAKKKLTDKLNNIFIQNISELLFHLENLLKTKLIEVNIDLNSYILLITAVLWFNRILDLSSLNMYINKEFNTDLFDKLILHFKWLNKNLIELIRKLVPNIEVISPKFNDYFVNIINYIESNKHPLDFRRKIYSKHLIEFQPLYQKEQIEIFLKAQKLDELLQLVPGYGKFTSEDIIKKLAVRSTEQCRKVSAILSRNYNVINFDKINEINLNHNDGDTVPKEIKLKLQHFLNNFENKSTVNNQNLSDELETLEKELETLHCLLEAPQQEQNPNLPEIPHETELGILSVREYFLVKFLISNLNNPSGNDEFTLNPIYKDNINYLNSSITSLLNTYELPYYREYRDIWLNLCNYINEIDTPNDFKELLTYLNGSYKHLSSLNKIILNLMQKLELESKKSIEYMKIHSSKNDMHGININSGSPFVNIISSIIFASESHTFKTVPLCDIGVWKNSLNNLCEITWSNSILTTQTYNTLRNNYSKSIQNSKRLLLEVNYIEMLCHKEDDLNMTSFTRCFKNITLKLKEYLAESSSESLNNFDSVEYQKLLYKTSLINSLIGCIELCLITFTPLIDPVEKNRLKNIYIEDDIHCLNYLKLAYDFAKITMKYKHFGDEIYETIKKRLDILKEIQTKHTKKVALRPDKCLYSCLVKDIAHFLTTNCNPEMFVVLIKNIESVWLNLFESNISELLDEHIESCEEIINKLNLWISNSQNFVCHTLRRYSVYYQDYIQPLQCSIGQLCFGFEGLITVLSQIKNSIIRNKNATYTKINANNRLHSVLQNIGEFPSSKMLNIFNVNSNKDVKENRCPVFSILNGIPGSETDYFHLLKAKLFELNNRVSISCHINQELFEEFDFAFNIINQTWQQEEELRRQKQKEEESLYLTKTKCEEENEDIQELREINELFPTAIENDFGDFIQEETLEKVMKLNKKNINSTEKHAFILQETDYVFIAKIFTNFLVKYSRSYYHPTFALSDNTVKIEFIDYFKERMRVFLRIYNFYKTSINDWLDSKCLSSLYFCLAMQKDLLSENLMTDLKTDTPYNFYKDANIEEIVSCLNVLSNIEQKVNKQIELYPEHATLLDIKKVIERIRLLPATSPVVRFNTGFQILRQHIALWNEVAHKNNNLKLEEQEVAQYVQKWTRLELQFWRNCLKHTYNKVESSAYRYWFFIYNLINEFITEHKVDFTLTDMKHTIKRFYNHEIVEPENYSTKTSNVEIKDIITILRQFIESSCYGDFCVRIQLLNAFELYLQNLVTFSSELNDELTNQLWDLIASLRNLQLYFDQFSNNIEEHKKLIRLPIEKKVKELVKIESYNKDLSYISMRNNVSRVHRNLYKYLKEYEQQLKEKISAVFQPKDCTTKDYNFVNDKGKDLRYDSKMKYLMVDTKYFVLATKPKQNEKDLSENYQKNNFQKLLSQTQRLFYTSRNIVKETISNAHYPKYIIALESLLTLQLERCDRLRNLTVDRTKERARQKLEAKQILQQKRKGLTDLFKALSVLGVNYKTGLMELSMNSEFEDMLLRPFCIKSMLNQSKEKRLQQKILQLNENLDIYFNKCIFKLKLLRNIMLTPLSELGPPNIERIKGYAVDLFLLVQNQRRLLSTTTKNMYDFRVILQQLKDLEGINTKNEIDESYVSFSKLRDHCQNLVRVLTHICYVFEQYKLFLSSAPTNFRMENIIFANDENINNKISLDSTSILKECETILSLSKLTLNNINKESSEFVSKNKLDQYMDSYKHLHVLIQNILSRFEISKMDYLPIATPLKELFTYMNESIQYPLGDGYDENLPCYFENFEEKLENVIHSMLISIQKLFKRYQTKISSEGEENVKLKKEFLEDDSEIQDQHLKKRLYESLKDDWKIINMDDLNKQVTNILLSVKLSKPSTEKIGYIKKILNIQPLLEQFNLMAEYFLYQQLGAHKVSVKMLSVMLTVFIEIGTKGFCVPQDLMQDEEGESKKDQKEGEGFGLEDGTGENDASDKIESEDQLDDAKRPEDRLEENNKNEENDCKEEKGIEMSDNFDGELQDVEKPNKEEDDSGESENEEEMNKEIGETEDGADKLDEQIWGDDETADDQEEENEMNDETGKGNQDENDTHNDLNTKNDTTKDDNKNDVENNGLDATSGQNEKGEEEPQNKQKNEINDQDADQDQDQVNPYHNELEEPNEPEDFDIGELNVNDDNEDDETHNSEDNPFDIDTMKDNMPSVDDSLENEKNADDAEEAKDQNEIHSSDESDDDEQSNLKNDDDHAEEDKQNEESKENDIKDSTDEQRREETEKDENNECDKEYSEEKQEEYEPSKDEPRNEENMQTVPDTESKGSRDQLEAEQSNKDVHQEQMLDEQNTGEENDGVGQAENEKKDNGHQGIAEAKEAKTSENNKTDANNKEKRKQGQSDENRSLGQAEHNKIKRLKTIDKFNEEINSESQTESEEKQNEADEYQHVKEPKTSDKLTLDNATEEQSKQIRSHDEEMKDDAKEDIENDENLMELNEETEKQSITEDDLQEISAEKLGKKSDNPLKTEHNNNNENIVVEELLEVEGESVDTMTVPRSRDTTAHCNRDILINSNHHAEELNAIQILEFRKMFQNQTSVQLPILPKSEDREIWQIISNRMTENARDLCEQLRLILEPTKCTRLKGDYRTGRRINMKKIIPYIASQFRKDKIWLRRTKPAQRDYKITIAIDDSKSMHHNNSKMLTLEAISLVSQALTLLESGRLSVISFGEQPRILLNHSEQFDGPKLVNSLQFSQDKTRIAELLDFIRIINVEENSIGSDNGIFENLLLILSDGCNIFSEGNLKVKNSIKLAKMQRIFLVYVIIDNPDNKYSILDKHTMEMLPDHRVNIKSYLEDFPFPYYIIVRDLNQLPTVLSEAMRQWFELVNSEQ